MRAAVIRGFTDLSRIERAEAWRKLRTSEAFLALEEALPKLLEIERTWAGWDAFRAARPPDDAASAWRSHETRSAALERMAPALGARLGRLWSRLNDRATAALLESYVAARADAADLPDALARLMSLYAEPLVFRWEVLPVEVARRLAALASVTLDRVSEGPLRPGALACRALARYSDRDRRGNLEPGAAEAVRTSLEAVLSLHPESRFVAPAVDGLVRTAEEIGRPDLARASYRAFREAHRGDPELLAEVRSRLGDLALRVEGLPEIPMKTVNGQVVDREFLRGKVVIVDFWATWCRPCVEGLTTLRKIRERYGDRVVVVAVNLDLADELSAKGLEDYVAREKLAGYQVFDGLGWESDLVRAFGVREIPWSVVAAPDGDVVAVSVHGKRLVSAVEAALK